ncbi:hypothetical protein KKF82_07155 [Patescibacteria group bacterium]|nr:hypothetical protein [Patescibacteria group bacterium]
MEIRIQANKVQKVSVRSKYDDDKLELTTTLQADLQLHPSDIARITNLLVQKVPLYLVLGSLQAQFDLEMVKIELPQPVPFQDEKPAPDQPAEELTRVVMLSEDAALHINPDGSKEFLSLQYDGLYLGPFAEICPPVDQLKKGAMLKLSFDHPHGAVTRVELAEPKDIADQHFAEQMEHDVEKTADQEFTKLGEERDRLVNAEAEAAQATSDKGTKPKRRSKKAKQLPL